MVEKPPTGNEKNERGQSKAYEAPSAFSHKLGQPMMGTRNEVTGHFDGKERQRRDGSAGYCYSQPRQFLGALCFSAPIMVVRMGVYRFRFVSRSIDRLDQVFRPGPARDVRRCSFCGQVNAC